MCNIQVLIIHKGKVNNINSMEMHIVIVVVMKKSLLMNKIILMRAFINKPKVIRPHLFTSTHNYLLFIAVKN